MNPVYPEYFADPFVWCHEGRYYAVGTSPTEDGVFPLLVSSNLLEWTFHNYALKDPPTHLGDTFWAPEVAWSKGTFYMHYSVGRDDKGHQIRMATSSRPEGPYTDQAGVTTLPFAIDPHSFQDDDGTWYLFYARDFLDNDPPNRAGTALVVDRLEDMHRLAGTEHVVMRAHHDWQRFMADRPMYGTVFDWHTLEGPCVRKRRGLYYCLYSGGRWEDASYGVDFAVAPSVTGPYSDAGAKGGARVLRTIPGEVYGPGHNSIVTRADGQDVIVYHAWDERYTARRMCVDVLEWCEQGPVWRRSMKIS